MVRQTIAGRILHDIKNRGVSAFLLSAALIFFYLVLYFGYDQAQPSGWFEQLQNWLYDNFTHHLDTLGGTLFGPIAAHLSPTGVKAALYAMVLGSGAWLCWNFRDDPPKLRNAAIATTIVTLGIFLFSRAFLRNELWAVLEPSSFSRWHIYGLLYTFAILGGGVWVTYKYRHNEYQVVRTLVVMLIQISFAFSIPILLKFFSHPEFYFSYLWPLKYDYLDPANFAYYGEAFVLWGFFGSLLLTPVMAILYGKRWYCSWVCGCGGLANTFGEPWRHLSSKKGWAWTFEKFSIHAVMILAILTTAYYFATFILPDNPGMQETASKFRTYYGWIVVASLSGAVGTGLYPIGGTRVWCRFFCPMAAVLGLLQKIGRYRIRVKRDMCISCGMCSKYCEMGIDVRAYAQANQSFTRASCVGCGLCAEVCPRGVLRLENAIKRDPQELSWRSLVNETWRAGDTAEDTGRNAA